MKDGSISSAGTSKVTLTERERERERETHTYTHTHTHTHTHTVRIAHRAVLNLYVIKNARHSRVRPFKRQIAEALYLDMARAKVSRS